jgi:uncharacterized protein (DUF1501 family)
MTEPQPDGAAPGRHLSRRRFLGFAAGAGAATVGGALAWNALIREHLEDAVASGPTPGSGSGATGGPARVLVVLQLNGGNDGLNTLVPAHDGRYFDARPTLQVKEQELVALGGSVYGLHPALQPLVPLWDAGRLAAVDAVGFLQGQTRSHFQSMDLWWSGIPGHERSTGWLGRWLDRTGDLTDPLRAIALGSGSPALVGERSVSTVVLNPRSFALRAPKGSDATQLASAFAATAEPLAADPDLAVAQRSVPSAMRAVELLGRAVARADDAGDDERGNQLTAAALLDVAAGVIDLDIGTRVIVINVLGYDTHANQAVRHPALLKDLGTGVSSFLQRIDRQGRSGQVMVMTTSEFGRRVAENGSGTDHGEGGVQFIAGGTVRGKQVVGDADLAHLKNGDLRSTIDTRSLYATALDWLSDDAQLTDDVLGGTFDRHGLLQT